MLSYHILEEREKEENELQRYTREPMKRESGEKFTCIDIKQSYKRLKKKDAISDSNSPLKCSKLLNLSYLNHGYGLQDRSKARLTRNLFQVAK